VGLTVLDAGVVIGFLDAADRHHKAALQALTSATQGGDFPSLPASALAECLVGPARRGDEAVDAVRAFIARVPIAVVPLESEVAVAAARLRARLGKRLRLPDALVVATAAVLEADTLLTTDRGWPSQRALGLRGRVVRL
jgi:predicted nucleic acid-binding protein